MLDDTKSILVRILGEPKRNTLDRDGWHEFNCPSCRDNNMGVVDNKYNLAIHLGGNESPYCHCWKCGYSGSITSLVGRYGTSTQLIVVKNELKSLGLLRLYIPDITGNVQKKSKVRNGLTLPDGYHRIGFAEEYFPSAYLKGRGIPLSLVEKYNIGYIGDDYTASAKMRCKIIIPSYDANGELNYWIGRDYMGDSRYKIQNAEAEKNEIVFNEKFVNWYEPVTIVEGPFDHIAVPNSIPLLGKRLSKESATYDAVTQKAMSWVNILLDEDAESECYNLFRTLNEGRLRGRVRICRYPKEWHSGSDEDLFDPSDFFKKYGPKGIIYLIHNTFIPSDFDLNTLWI